MLTVTTVFLVLSILVGFYMAWNIGANDVANAFGTSVGSGALTLLRAIILAGIFEFCGAYFVGANVADTIKGGIVPFGAFGDARQFGVGMLAALLAAGVWLNVATFLGQPVSTTHAIIGAVVGFACVAIGPEHVRWGNMGSIAASWIISPLFGALLAYLVYRLILRFVLNARHPVFRARAAVPLCLGSVIFIVILSILCAGPPKLAADRWMPLILPDAISRLVVGLPLGMGRIILALPLALLLSFAAAMTAHMVIRRQTRDRHIRIHQRYATIERWFSRIQIVSACYMAFAHGANDVANAVGPMAATIEIFSGRSSLAGKTSVPSWLLAFGGIGIVVGLATYGYKVLESVGRKITEITPTRGFSAEVGTATTVLVCSALGLPISTTFVLVGAVMGVGLARGFAAIDLGVIKKIFASWIVTIPISAFLAAIFYWILRAFL